MTHKNRQMIREIRFELIWPELAACMARAARSSGVPFATLAKVAEAARKALAECGRSTWIGSVSCDPDDPRNWRYNRLPGKGDACIYDASSGSIEKGMDLSALTLGSIVITRSAADAGFTIGKRGKAIGTRQR